MQFRVEWVRESEREAGLSFRRERSPSAHTHVVKEMPNQRECLCGEQGSCNNKLCGFQNNNNKHTHTLLLLLLLLLRRVFVSYVPSNLSLCTRPLSFHFSLLIFDFRHRLTWETSSHDSLAAVITAPYRTVHTHA